jgi:protein O-mannosyl-transferase
MAESNRTLHRRAVFLLPALAILAYANSFWGTFQFDDVATILEDPRLESLSSFFSSAGRMIRPAVKLTFLADRRLFGDHPAGYHLLNLLLHLGSGLLIYRILLRALSCKPEKAAPGGFPALPFWTGLLFLMHPLGTETVTYISGRPTGLMAFFYLASVYLYIRSTDAEDGAVASFPAYLGAILCFGLSLLSKEAAITLPAALLLYDLVIRGRGVGELRHSFLRRHLPFWAVLFLFLLAGAFHPRYSFLFRYGLEVRPGYENFLTQVHTVAYSLSLFFLPWRLNFDHDLPVYGSILQGPVLFSLALLAGILAAAFGLMRRRPFISFGLLWFFLHLIPTNSILPRYDLLSERNLYLPSAGLYLAFVSLFLCLAKQWKPQLSSKAWSDPRVSRLGPKTLAILLALFLVLLTIHRNEVYADPVAFWSDAVRKSPHKARPHNNLGYAYFRAGDVDRAIVEFRLSLSLDPFDPAAQRNLRQAWAYKKDHGERRADDGPAP